MKRLDSLDVLKVLLTMLVVAHHAGQPYSNGGWWYFQSKQQTLLLGRFFAVNAAFFMSLFFLLSGYFLPASFDRKGTKQFLKDRLIRLGIPLLFGLLVIMPLLMYTYYVHFRGYSPISFSSYYFKVFFGLSQKPPGWSGPSWPDLQFGHLWFIEHLLVYALLYALWRKVTATIPWKNNNKMPGFFGILLFTVLLAIVTFLVRIWYPIDKWVGFLGIIQTEFAHVPQYASCFVIGIVAYRKGWLEQLPRKTGLVWLMIGVLLAISVYAFDFLLSPFIQKGGLNNGSFLWSLMDSFMCIGLSVGLITLFRETVNTANRWFKWMIPNAFAVYIFHVPILVILQYSIADFQWSAISKFLFVTVFGIILSFVFCSLIRKIPAMKRVL